MKLFVDTRAMNDKSHEIRALCDELNDNMRQVELLVYAAGDVWKGDAERAFEARLVCMQQRFADVTGHLEHFAELLDNFAAQYEEHDRDLASRINLA